MSALGRVPLVAFRDVFYCCSVRESDSMTSQYRFGGDIRIYPWYLILDTHSPYVYIYTYFYILYFHIYIYFFQIYIQYCILTVLLFEHTRTHIWVDWCSFHIFCSKSPKMVKHWVKFALEALQPSGDCSCTFAASGPGWLVLVVWWIVACCPSTPWIHD